MPLLYKVMQMPFHAIWAAMLWACVCVRFAWRVVPLNVLCCELFFQQELTASLSCSFSFLCLVTSGIAWLHTLGVCGPAVCLCLDGCGNVCAVFMLIGGACMCGWTAVVVPSRCLPAWLTRPRCPLHGARQQSPGRGTAFCHLFLISLLCHFLFFISCSVIRFFGIHFPLTSFIHLLLSWSLPLFTDSLHLF